MDQDLNGTAATSDSGEALHGSEPEDRPAACGGGPARGGGEGSSEQPTTEQTLRRLLEFERLVTELSTGFINLPDSELDRAVHDALGAIGRFAGVDRSYVFLFSEDLTLATNTHEWCAPGIEPEVQNLQELPTEAFSWWMERFLRFDDVYVPTVAELPLEGDSPREFLEGQGIQALVAVPLLQGSRLLGFLGFDSVRCTRTWSQRELTLLRLVGDILANAIHRRFANRRLAQIESELQNAQKLEAIGRLAGGMAHDFNNLLTAIGGFSGLLQEQLAPGDPRLELVAEISGAVRRASALTQQLLVFGRRPAGHPEVLCLNQVIADAERLFRGFIPEDVHLEIDLDPELGNLEIDRGQIEQVVLNLLLNARDAVTSGGHIRIATERHQVRPHDTCSEYGLGAGDHVRLVVEDDGRGMDESVRNHVFEPFFTTKEVGEGTGLGLSTVYGIVSRQSGWIGVDSSPGRGTRFEVLLPAVTAPVSEMPGPSAPAASGAGTILVVEDEPAVRTLIAQVLRGNGFEVIEAADGVQALELTTGGRHRIDLLVTDVVMPHMDGPSLAEKLRRANPRLGALFISGYPGNLSHDRLDLGGFLQKPFTPAALLEAVHALLDPDGQQGTAGAPDA